MAGPHLGYPSSVDGHLGCFPFGLLWITLLRTLCISICLGSRFPIFGWGWELRLGVLMEVDTLDTDVPSPFLTQLPGQGPPSPHAPGRKSGATSLETWQVVWEGRAVDPHEGPSGAVHPASPSASHHSSTFWWNITYKGTSLMAQWLGIRLPMQGTRVRALVREDPTWRGAAGPVRHGCWACALGPASRNCWARVPQLLGPVRLELVLRNRRGRRGEGPACSNEDTMQPKINK